MFLSCSISKRLTFYKALNQIFTCGSWVWEWNIHLQQCPCSPKSNSISWSWVLLKIWVLHSLIFQGFHPAARSCRLPVPPGCFCSWAQRWGKQKAVHPSGKEAFKAPPVCYPCLLGGKDKHSDSCGAGDGEVHLHRRLQAPTDSVIIKNQDACYSSKLFIQDLNAFIILIEWEWF